jgi:tetratricopeptide (TPR) repeat protein
VTRSTALNLVLLSVAFAPVRQAEAQTAKASSATVTRECQEFSTRVLDQVANGNNREAEQELRIAIWGETPSLDSLCSALAMANLATLMSVSDHPREAERYAQDTVDRLRSVGAVGDELLVRPLQVLVTSCLQQGRVNEARQAFEKLSRLQVEQPEALALVHGTRAALLEFEGKLGESEGEWLGSLHDWESAGRGNSVDSGAALNGLASLYLKQKRYGEAVGASDRALSIFATAKATVVMDSITALGIRATAHAQRAEWHEARQDMQQAVSIAEHEPRFDPTLLSDLLTSYAHTLRKDHCSREARAVQTRASALHATHPEQSVVDVTELAQKRKEASR